MSFFQYNLPKRNEKCSIGLEPLAPGDSYYSILIEEGEEILRKDFCINCWEQLEKNGALPSEVYWKSKAPLLKKRESVSSKDREAQILDLLKEALQSNTEETHKEAFVLALFLARRRKLRLRQQVTQNNGLILQLYEVAATEEMLAVPRVTLSDREIESLQKRIASKFSLHP